MNNSGTVEPDEFAKAIEKIGIMIPTKQDLDTLFNLYDTDRSGGLSYKEFSAALFTRPGTASGGAKGNRSPEELAEALKAKLISRGSRGFIGLQRQFKIMDDNNSRSLDKYEFTKAMTDYMLGFTEGEIQKLFAYFDFDRSGLIEFDEFIRAIRGPMNNTRKRVVAQAFKKLDKDGNGWIDINDIRGVYNAVKHPDVLQGKKTEDQILQEFLETFETAHSMRNNQAPNHVVTKEEFDEYYNNISASIDDDAYFQTMMENAWKLTEDSRKGMGTKGWSGDNSAKQRAAAAQSGSNIFGTAPRKEAPKEQNLAENANDQQLLENLRERLKKRGTRGISSISKKFKIADDNRSGTLDKEEFAKAMHDFRIGMNPRQVARTFDLFDRDGSGDISYDEFLRMVRGEMNQFRQGIAMKAFKIMDKDGSGQLDINDIRGTYNAKQHPDVKAGKKTED